MESDHLRTIADNKRIHTDTKRINSYSKRIKNVNILINVTLMKFIKEIIKNVVNNYDRLFACILNIAVILR
jgi:hypothetical protein